MDRAEQGLSNRPITGRSTSPRGAPAASTTSPVPRRPPACNISTASRSASATPTAPTRPPSSSPTLTQHPPRLRWIAPHGASSSLTGYSPTTPTSPTGPAPWSRHTCSVSPTEPSRKRTSAAGSRSTSPGRGLDMDLPFQAVLSSTPTLSDRDTGRWERLGDRRSEGCLPLPPSYFLWTWTNPRPEVPLTAVTVTARRGRLLVAALTIGHLDEAPFVRTGARPAGPRAGSPAATWPASALPRTRRRGGRTWPARGGQPG